jgi:hypothetical protein
MGPGVFIQHRVRILGMRLLRGLFLVLFSLSGLSAQVDFVFEFRLKYGSSQMNALPPTVIEQRVLIQDQMLRLERAGFFLQVDSKAGTATIGDPRKRAYVEMPVKNFLELKGNPLQAENGNVPPMKLDTAAQAPAFRWLDRPTTGKVCASTGPLVVGQPERGTAKNRLTVYSLPMEEIVGNTLSGLEREQLMRITQNQIGLQAAPFLKECIGIGEAPVRLVLQSEVEATQARGFRADIEYLVKSVANVPIPKARFEVPNDWKKAPESEALLFVMVFSAAPLTNESGPFRDLTRSLSKESLLAEIEGLKKLVEEEKWEAGQKRVSEISYQFFLKVKEAQGPPPKQLEALEAKLAGGRPLAYDAQEAARLAFELFDPVKVRKYSQLCLELMKQPGSPYNGDIIHLAHTFLGMMDWRDGQRESALAHLAAAGEIQGGPVTKSFGPRMELAKLLLEGGEKDQVLKYLENCKKFWSMEGGIPKLERWIAAVQAGTPPDFGFLATMYKLPVR